VVPIIQEHRRISKQLSQLQGLLEQVCQVDAHARATAEACSAMLAGAWLCSEGQRRAERGLLSVQQRKELHAPLQCVCACVHAITQGAHACICVFVISG